MSSNVRISVQDIRPAASVKARLRLFATGFAPDVMQRVADYLDEGPVWAKKLFIATTAVAASGTATFSGAGTAGDTVTIAGQAFTAVASGAGNNQWNVGASASASAINLAAAINASTTASFAGIASAAAVAAVVTITARIPGNVGNQITLAKSSTAITVSGANLTGGSEDSPNVTLYVGQ